MKLKYLVDTIPNIIQIIIMSPIYPIIPNPTPIPSPSPDEDDYAEMPALLCCKCNMIHSKGGYIWEAEHPSELHGMCNCHEIIIPDVMNTNQE